MEKTREAYVPNREGSKLQAEAAGTRMDVSAATITELVGALNATNFDAFDLRIFSRALAAEKLRQELKRQIDAIRADRPLTQQELHWVTRFALV